MHGWWGQVHAWCRRHRAGLAAVSLLGPSIVLLGAMFFYPLLGILLRSLNADGDLSYTAPTFDIKNYSELVDDAGFRAIFRTTFKLAFITTVVCLVLGYPVAYALARLPRAAAAALMMIIMVPFWTSILVRLYAWTVILSPRGIANKGLEAVHITNEPVSLLFNLTGVVIGSVHYLLPFNILVLYSTMVGIDRRLVDAAYSLGASPLYMFRKVYFPLTLRGVYAGSLLVFIVALGYFVTPAILGGADAKTLPMYIQEEAQRLNWGLSSAMGMVLLAITIGLFAVLSRALNVERVVTGVRR